MDLHTLEMFLELAKTLHFGKTSRACNITPSALSRAIQRLEQEVGLPLFFRDNRSVRLSPTGAEFRLVAQDILDRWQHFRESVTEDSADLTGEITLYCSVTASYTVLSDLFDRFRRAHPGIHIKLQTGDAAEAIDVVVAGRADLTVAARPDRLPHGLLFRTITITPLVFIAPVVDCEVARLAGTSSVPWDTIPMVLSEQGLSRRRVDSWFRARHVNPNIYAEVAGHEAIIPMVRLGCGVGVVPELVLEKSAFRDDVRIVPVDEKLPPYNVGLCLHKRRLASPVVRAFWDVGPGR